MFDWIPLIVILMAFISVAGIIFVIGLYMANQAAIQRRLPVSSSSTSGLALSQGESTEFLASLAGKIDERKFGIEGPLRAKLRRNLIRAGYFSGEAIRLYVIARLVLVLVLPPLVFVSFKIFLPAIGSYLHLLAVAISAFIAILGVDFYISRRQGSLQQEYRSTFPDLIDMLVVCIDAGLSLDAAFARVAPEVAKESSALGTNLVLLGAETRAGRAMPDALDGFADRLNLDEARAFVIMLRQSLELGTDIGSALRVFSDEMRTRRLLRGEENANKLVVKIVIPLGLFIFPVVLEVILVPVIIKFMQIAETMAR